MWAPIEDQEAAAGTRVTYSLGRQGDLLLPAVSLVPFFRDTWCEWPGCLFPHISFCVHKQEQLQHPFLRADADGDQATLILLEHAFCTSHHPAKPLPSTLIVFLMIAF